MTTNIFSPRRALATVSAFAMLAACNEAVRAAPPSDRNALIAFLNSL